MAEKKWDLREIKKVKKKLLVQYNIAFLLIFLLYSYFAENVKLSFLIGLFCVFSLIVVAILLYIRLTGKSFGTKASRKEQAFDRDRIGEKRWKRQKINEIVAVGVSGVVMAVVLFSLNVDSTRFDSNSIAYAFVGTWIGLNISQIIRIKRL
ncbi:hypothetical protein [Jeotgalibacillus campisalis]|uniref:Uncharacterized protein n=1 Tax=Jeotgalibacillus campisalis TaxID=220754 RepID=A0A0C2QYV1_9BACL|nr:hypothetical protein [Jeotgalibacillus campisalis]KIL43230.1 hypothetical protein KR50_36330 [Jeotgalibacillus campisalis]